MEFASNLNDTTVRLQDAPSVFSNVAVGTVGDKIIFDYFQDNWLRLYNEFVLSASYCLLSFVSGHLFSGLILKHAFSV